MKEKSNLISSQCKVIESVIEAGICVTCGACVGLCPYFDYFDGKVVILDQCQSDEGRCATYCPRIAAEEVSFTNPDYSNDPSNPLGHFSDIFIARSKDAQIIEKAQCGGIVSTIIIYALEKGFISGAVLTDGEETQSPGGIIVRHRDGVLNCSGSRYHGSAALSSLNRAMKNGEKDLAVVGLPCQMEAVAHMQSQHSDGETKEDPIRLKVGIFCTWALEYRRFHQFIEERQFEKPIIKYDIPPPPAQVLKIMTEKAWQSLPLDDIRPFIQKGCSLCRDMTAERADISVGTVEGIEGWNTVLVRSDFGSKIIQAALEDEIFEIDQLPAEMLNHLEEASSKKRKKGMLALEAHSLKGARND